MRVNYSLLQDWPPANLTGLCYLTNRKSNLERAHLESSTTITLRKSYNQPAKTLWLLQALTGDYEISQVRTPTKMLNSCTGLLKDCFNIGELDTSVFELHYLVGLQLVDQAGNGFGTNADQFSDLTFFTGMSTTAFPFSF